MQFFQPIRSEQGQLDCLIERLQEVVVENTKQLYDGPRELSKEQYEVLYNEIMNCREEFQSDSWIVISVTALSRLNFSAIASKLSLTLLNVDAYQEDCLHLYDTTLGKIDIPDLKEVWKTEIVRRHVRQKDIILFYAFATLSKCLLKVIDGDNIAFLYYLSSNTQFFKEYVVASFCIAMKQFFDKAYKNSDLANCFGLTPTSLNKAEENLMEILGDELPPTTSSCNALLSKYMGIIDQCLPEICSESKIFAQFQKDLLNKNTNEGTELYNRFQDLKGRLAQMCGRGVPIQPIQMQQTRTTEISPPPTTPAGPSVSFSPIPTSQ